MSVATRPGLGDLGTVGRIVGRVLAVEGCTMLLPATVSLLRGEWNAACALVSGAALGILAAVGAERLPRTRADIRWADGMVASGLTWLAAPLLAAVPLFLSGHFGDFLDAYFDAMSGFTTTGLSVMNDLDHVADGINLWRHVTHFLGGQGLVLLTLTFFASGGGAVGMYAGEAREDKILPNVLRTARFIWRAALAYFVVGAGALFVVLLWAGLSPGAALLHAVSLFAAAFDTGGFSPRSTSIAYYHSPALEGIIAVLMVTGAISFAVHFQLWQGRWRELIDNVELRTAALTVGGTFAVILAGLVTTGVYGDGSMLYRRAWFQILSAHTGTGFATVSGAAFAGAWGVLAPAAMIVAMGLGGMSGSTTGGIKAIRVALAGKAIQREYRAVILPRQAVVLESYHHLRRQTASPQVERAALVILLAFLALYMLGTLVGLGYGYPLELALFESVSAGAAVGLSAGVTAPDMPDGLMATYILQMYVGRLEFVSALAFAGYTARLLDVRP